MICGEAKFTPLRAAHEGAACECAGCQVQQIYLSTKQPWICHGVARRGSQACSTSSTHSVLAAHLAPAPALSKSALYSLGIVLSSCAVYLVCMSGVMSSKFMGWQL